VNELLPELDVVLPQRQRRLTVLLRLLLLIPQFIVLAVLGVAAFFVAIAGWFAALVIGRLPTWAYYFLSGYLAYTTRVRASEVLLVDRYPPFSFDAPGYPVQIDLQPAELNRFAVLARIILIIPAAIVYGVLTAGWEACAFFIWLIVLVMGRMPEPLFEATAAISRYLMRVEAYWLMLTTAYPKRLFGDGTGQATPGANATRPFLMTTAGRVILIVIIVVGLASAVGGGIGGGSGNNDSTYAQSVNP
jgi:Domain of unknown function (DUF4389)